MFVAPQIIGSCCAKDSVESVEQPWPPRHSAFYLTIAIFTKDLLLFALAFQ
jgi:hypothetical protein